METVLSGIRSTGNLHLGNYFGALKNFVRMQHDERCFFFIADYHSLTTHPDPGMLHVNVKSVLCEYLAAGLDPDVATIYVQSDVPEVAELSLLLGMHAFVGELERTASFKEKIRKHPDNVNIGLLSYPVLMAADILQHRATRVPVGKDQEQHLELTRRFAGGSTSSTGSIISRSASPIGSEANLVKIPGLDGSGKMGKSEGNGIYLSDTDEAIPQESHEGRHGLGSYGSRQPDARSDREPLHAAQSRLVARHGAVLHRQVEPLRNPLRRPEKATGRGHHPGRRADPRADPRHRRPTRPIWPCCRETGSPRKPRASASATVADVRRILGIKPF